MVKSKKIAAFGLAVVMTLGSSMAVFANEYPVDDYAGNTYFYGAVYAEASSAGAYMTSSEIVDLYIEDGECKDYWGDTYRFSGASEQSTYVSAYSSSSSDYVHAEANFICCSNDGYSNTVFGQINR